LELAAAEVDHINGSSWTFRPEDLRMKGVVYELTLFLVAHQLGLAQDAEVMRDMGQAFADHLGKVTDAFWTALKALNDLQAIRVSQRLEEVSALNGLKAVAHTRVTQSTTVKYKHPNGSRIL
jgi:hypothetical protein